MSKIAVKIKELNEKLLHWSMEYYAKNTPSISDQEYDQKYQEYNTLIKQYPDLEPKNSILQKVGFKSNNKFIKVKHQFPMLSLANAFNKEDIFKFDKQVKDLLHDYQDKSYSIEPKIDGLSISLIYENGKLTRGITRGDGIVGEDVTHNVRAIKDIPQEINYYENIEFRGEIFITKSVFQSLNKSDQKFANPRNAAAGSLRQLNPEIVKQRNLSAFIYAIPNALSHKIYSREQLVQFIKSNGLPVNPHTFFESNIHKAWMVIENLSKLRQTWDYEVDGIVLKLNNIKIYEDVGYTVKFPKYMIAYKFPAELAVTELLDIFATIGRTGRVTYNARLNPISLGGTTISAATLHNASYIEKLDINKGDVVQIKKAGDIIPKVVKVIEKQNKQKWEVQTSCPVCKTTLVKFQEEIDQYCPNQLCPAIHLAKMEHFVCRNAMNIEGISKEIIKTLLNHQILTDLPSIFDLPLRQDDILKLEGFKNKLINNIISAIEKAKNVELDKFLFALGIRHVGQKNAKIIAQRFGSIHKIVQASKDDIEQIRDLGPKVAQSLSLFFGSEQNVKLVHDLIEKGVKIQELQSLNSQALTNLTFVLTGTLSKSREYFKNLIEKNNGNVTNAVSNRTNYLLAGENPGTKLIKAQKLQIPVLSEADFEQLLKDKYE